MRLDFLISELQKMNWVSTDRAIAHTIERALHHVDTRTDLLDFLQTNGWAFFANSSQPVALAEKLAYTLSTDELATVGITLNQPQLQSMEANKPYIMVNTTDEWISLQHTESSPTLYCGKYHVTVPAGTESTITAGEGCFVENQSKQKVEFKKGSYGLDPNRIYYVPALFLQFEEDTTPFERHIYNGNYEQVLPEAWELIGELGGMESLDRLFHEASLSSETYDGDCLYAENDNIAVVYNSHVGGTVSIQQKMGEAELIEHLLSLSESKYVLQGYHDSWKGSSDAENLLNSLRLKTQFEPSGQQIDHTQAHIQKPTKGYLR